MQEEVDSQGAVTHWALQGCPDSTKPSHSAPQYGGLPELQGGPWAVFCPSGGVSPRVGIPGTLLDLPPHGTHEPTLWS